MGADPRRTTVTWRLHLRSSPEQVFDMLDTDTGRAAFWAETADEHDGEIAFHFINGLRYQSRVLERDRPAAWSIEYFGSTVTVQLVDEGAGGTDLTLVNEGIPEEDHREVMAGWLNVLLPLKAAVDFKIDLRSHDPTRTWDQGYIDQ